MPDFASVHDVGGNLLTLADQVRRAVAWMHAKLTNPLIVASGSLESPEFRRQVRNLAVAVRDAGKPVQLPVG
jgi:hypothetical protein